MFALLGVIIVVLLASYTMLGIELLYAYFNTSSSDIAEVYEDSDWDLEYFLEKELLVLLDAFAVRGVRAWCSSVVFERGIRARSARIFYRINFSRHL